ncbi:hypothetical protein H0I39_09140 [Ottowia beijingensis]|uniref:Uncharacterized protein n=2 Tax=Ottowia beijingensis TaxID=1207057 RepID=A0A853INP8_9BURK|nr:hypothetical protein [Ottowia beijingensis]
MDKANGQMLFRYRVSHSEYQELKDLLSDRLKNMAGSPWRVQSDAEAALFVLYASEWWRREYAGGAWRWTSIFESLTLGPYRVDPLDRSVIVERGLSAWRHRPSEDGKKYLGAIVAHGGLPLKLIARGDGVISRLLLSATRRAQVLTWGEPQLLAYFESQRDDLVQHLRAPEIYRLLSEMVLTVMSLRGEHKLSGVGNPVAVLDQREPKWRERFPIAVDDQSVESLLAGLVREVSRQTKTSTAYPVSVVRTLVQLADSGNYALSMSVSVVSTISVDAFASAMQMSSSEVPLHSFSKWPVIIGCPWGRVDSYWARSRALFCLPGDLNDLSAPKHARRCCSLCAVLVRILRRLYPFLGARLWRMGSRGRSQWWRRR